MNEEQVGTPNPLNPSPLDANPSEPMERARPVQPARPAQAARPIGPTRPMGPTRPARPIGQTRPVAPAEKPLTEELVQESVMVESVGPESRPIEKATEVAAPAPAKKKKTGLIVGLIICLFVAVGCGVAAALMLMNAKKDPVVAAVEKLMNGDVPSNVAIVGSIEILANDASSTVSKVNVSLDSQLKPGSLINSSNANIVLTTADEDEMVFRLSEIYAGGEEVFLKAEQIETATAEDNALLAEEGTLSTEEDATLADESEETLSETNCVGDETGETNCEVPEVIAAEDDLTESLDGILGEFDGEWIRIAVSEEMLSDNVLVDDSMSCMVDALKGISGNSNSLAEYYEKNPFINSTTDNIPISNNTNQLRQVTFDDEKLTSFLNAVQNTSTVKAVNDCLGSSETTVTTEDVINMISKLPAIYVEVNPDNTFSRFYTKVLTDDNNYTITIDLSFTYPTSINVSEPEEYTDLEELMQQMMGGIEVEDDAIEVENAEGIEEE